MTTTIDLADVRRSAPKRRTFQAPVTWEREARSDDRTVRGHAAVFRDVADIGAFTEEISPGAFHSALSRPSADPYLLFGHDPDKILARKSAGTLSVAEDERGLAFAADLVLTSLGDDVLTLVRTRHLSQCSFSFTVESDTWEQRDGKPHRVIREIRDLHELTLTGIPAYPTTDVREKRATTQTLGRLPLKVQERSSYGLSSQHSWFADLAVVAASDRRKEDSRMSPVLRGADPGDIFAQPGETTRAEEARKRLAVCRDESRALTTASNFNVAAGPPLYVSEAFAVAARAQGRILDAIGSQPVPKAGMHVEVAKFNTGASVSVQASGEGAAVSSTDPADTFASSLIAYVSGQVDASRQWADRASPASDVVMAGELGRALGAAADSQIIYGTGANQQTKGLASSSPLTRTFTQATPTIAQTATALWGGFADASTVPSGYGIPDQRSYFLILHPRRFAYLMSGGGFSPPIPGTPVLSGSISTTIGAGTNQDEAYLVAADIFHLFSDPVEFSVMPDVLSGTLQLRFSAIQELAALVVQPSGVVQIRGTGFAATL